MSYLIVCFITDSCPRNTTSWILLNSFLHTSSSPAMLFTSLFVGNIGKPTSESGTPAVIQGVLASMALGHPSLHTLQNRTQEQ